MQSFFSYIKENKIKSAIVIIIVLAVGYYLYKLLFPTPIITRYVLGNVQKSTVISTVSGTGQISSGASIDVKPKVSGDILSVNVKNGQYVSAGQSIVVLDNTSALKNVRDAQIRLDQAKLALQRMKGGAVDTGEVRSTTQKASDALLKSYDDGFNTVASTFIDLPAAMTGLHDVLLNSDFGMGQQPNIAFYFDQLKVSNSENADKAKLFSDDANKKYTEARAMYDRVFLEYKNTNRNSSNSDVERLINDTYDTDKAIAEAIKSSQNLIRLYQDTFTLANMKIESKSNTHLTSLNTYTGMTNGHLVDLLAAKDNILSNKESIVTSSFDLTDQEISIKQAENALQDARDTLANYVIRAPIDGIVGKLSAVRGDTASSTSLATIITTKKIAQISLNEVDVAKIKVGDKVTLTFDAIPDLTVVGLISDIDSIGTVSSGVVNYNIKISFDSSNDSIKEGMSVSAAIITKIAADVVVVPNSALKTKNGNSFVEVFDVAPAATTDGLQGAPSAIAPKQVGVEIGISDDTNTEIISGLKVGDNIVTKTITATTVSTANTAPSLLGAVGGNKSGARAMTGR